MVDNIMTTNSQSHHINWQELRKASQVFMVDPAQGISHILTAGHHSHWQ